MPNTPSVNDDNPLRNAWVAYQQTERYANTMDLRRAAFEAGFQAGIARGLVELDTLIETAATLRCTWDTKP